MIICYYCDVTLPIYNDVFLNALKSAKYFMPNIPRLLLTTVAAAPLFPKEIKDLINETYTVIFPTHNTNYKFYPYRRCLAQCFVPGDVLFIDTDTAFTKDVSYVFDDKTFDVAATKLSYPNAMGIAAHTHNAGVCFSRNNAFWWKLVGLIEKESDHNAVEIHYSNLCNSSTFKIKHLDDRIYNFIPDKTPGNIKYAEIIHYLRHRKTMISKQKWDARIMSKLG